MADLVLPEEIAFSVAEAARDCVCAELDRLATLDIDPRHPGCPCWVDIWPGEPPHLMCCEDCDGEAGQLSIHVAQLFETTSFPNVTPSVHPCAPQAYTAEIVVTVLRCLPSINETGEVPTPDEVTAVSKVTLADARAVHTALACCLPGTHPTKGKKRRVVVRPSTAIAPTTCAGTQTRAFVDLGASCRCPTEGS